MTFRLDLSCVNVLREIELVLFRHACSTLSRMIYLQRQMWSFLPIESLVQPSCSSHRMVWSLHFSRSRSSISANLANGPVPQVPRGASVGSSYDVPGGLVISGFHPFSIPYASPYHLFFAPALGLTSSGATGCSMTLFGVCVVLLV